MAVEARHLHLFSPQLITNREMMNPVETNVNSIYNNMGYSSVPPSSIKTAATEALILPPYNSITADSLPQKTAMNSDSGLTYNVPLRKRSRDSRDYSNSINFAFQNSYLPPSTAPQNNKSCASSSFSFLGEDISLQIQRQQLDIDQLIAQQMEKVKFEIEEKRKRQAMRLIQAIDMSVTKRLKAKEEEIEKIARTNWALEERVKSLCMENQIWRDLAQSNEATANALRSNLEQLLAQRVGEDNGDTISPVGRHAALIDDAESCCDSNESINDEENVVEWRSIGDNDYNNGRSIEAMKMIRNCGGGGGGDSAIGGSNFVNSMKLCSNCGKDESCVLILPCRHLCLCAVCGSNLHICPICKSFKTASIHVNMS